MRTISRDVYKLLMAQGLSAGTAATVKARGNKSAGVSYGATTREVTAASRGSTAEEVRSGVRLVWSQATTIGGRTANVRRPMLVSVK